MFNFAGATTEKTHYIAPQERRQHERINVKLAVREMRPERHLICATSVSVGGLYCPDAPPRPLGTHVLVRIDLPDGGTTAATARIASANGRRGYAIVFDSPVTELLEYLQRG